MIRSIIAAALSFLFPGLGHLMINFQLLKGFVISFGYIVIVLGALSNPATAALLLLLVPFIHVLAAVSAYRY